MPEIGKPAEELEKELAEVWRLLEDAKETNASNRSKMRRMYDALVQSGSINRIPEAHHWVNRRE